VTKDLERAGRKLRSARKALKDAMTDAEDAARASWESGATEVEIARTLGVDRMTVRKWRGKL
jgi:DNA-binding CsgD family transcriptional regulator